ncbi:hypothetical protein BHM03_00000992 [Ensete ventricosum]|nr:hypothetical protein BHM03_00000992 [Ensete ventricosum]
MGGLCSKRSAVDKSPSETAFDSNGLRDNPLPTQSRSKMQGDLARSRAREAMEKRLQQQPFSSSEGVRTPIGNIPATSAEATEPQFLRSLSHKSRSTKSKPSTSGKSGATKASSCPDIVLLFIMGWQGTGEACRYCPFLTLGDLLYLWKCRYLT